MGNLSLSRIAGQQFLDQALGSVTKPPGFPQLLGEAPEEMVQQLQAAASALCSCSLSQHTSKLGTTTRDHCLRNQERYIPGYTSLEDKKKKTQLKTYFQLYIINLVIIYTFLCHHLILSKYRTVQKQLVPKHLLSLCYLWWLQVESMLQYQMRYLNYHKAHPECHSPSSLH